MPGQPVLTGRGDGVGGTLGRVCLRDPEVEQLRQQLAGALDHHHVRALDVAVDDAELVRGVNDLT